MKRLLLYFCFAYFSLWAQDRYREMIPSYQEAAQKRIELTEKMQVSKEAKLVMEKSAKEIQEKNPSPGLKVGALAPDFELENTEHKMLKLSDWTAKGPIVLCFLHGSWCPYCNIELNVLTQSLSFLKKFKAQLIVISPQTIQHSQDLKEKFGGAYEILCDPDNQVSKAYKVHYELPEALIKLYKEELHLDLEAFNGKGHTDLPFGATFIIDKANKITAAFCETDYRKRMEPQDILIALSKLISTSPE